MSETPYSVLAGGYDEVMEHVDYPVWAGYIHALINEFQPGATSIVELGCGTGKLAVYLQPSGPPPSGYEYFAFDGSEAMVSAAQRRMPGSPVTFGVSRFEEAVPAPPADVVLLLYDGLNYLLDEADVSVLLERIHDGLVPGGLAIIDQSTPANSEKHVDGFDDSGETPAFTYVRTSRYDPDGRKHTTVFDLTLPDGSKMTETHVQRAYSLEEVRALIQASPLTALAALDDDGTAPADEMTDRIHWVLRRPL